MTRYHLSGRDIHKLKTQERYVDSLLMRHGSSTQGTQRSNVWTRLFKTPAGGIPARSGDTPGSALCELVWIDGSDELAVIATATDQTVWNISTSVIPEESYIVAVLDPWSKWIAVTRTGELFEVAMSQTGGSQGNATTAPSWTYTVTDIDGNSLATTYSPVSSGYWVRHLGQMAAATRGIASYNSAGDLKVLWCNEQQITEECV